MQREPILPFKNQEMVRIHPLLPETRSQMIVPLRTPQGIIGILDLHSRERADFDQADIASFLPIADQIALICAGLFEG
jgi:GAF domain-containing protein